MVPREEVTALAARFGLPPEPWLELLGRCGVSDPQAWVAAGQERVAQLESGLGADSLRWGLWLPLYSRVRQLLARGERLVLGVNGPIGSGKSTLMAVMREWAAADDLPLAVASIDDAYRCWEQRQTVLAGNPFGVWRGPPGSHDVELLLDRLAHWQAGGELVLPRFDKRLRQGQGDRSGAWRGAPQLLLLEGWLIGCRALPPARLLAAAPERGTLEGGGMEVPPGLRLRPQELAWLPIWNENLRSYGPLWEQLAGLWVLRPSCWLWPRRWRLQAEARQRRGGYELDGVGQGAGALAAADLEGLVRACLVSLPPRLYQDPLVAETACRPGDDGESGLRTEAVVLLDSRRRCRWSGPADWFRGADVEASGLSAVDQASPSPSSSATG